MASPVLLSRQAWASASGFHPLSEGEVLREVSNRVAALRAGSSEFLPPHPLVVLDLDSTLYEVAPRTARIIQEWLQSASASAAYPLIRAALEGLREDEVGYSIRDTLKARGVDLTHSQNVLGWQALKDFWIDRFFTSEYLPYDRPYPGAADFARQLHQLGAELVYLTGRDEPAMGVGTRKNLVRDGFPWDQERTHALLKPSDELTDLEHKKRAADWLRDHGTLVASFENEPLNLVMLFERFPEAMHIFVDTVCSDREAPVVAGLYRIGQFPAMPADLSAR